MVCGEDARKVYLPQGQWMDYWSGNSVEEGWIEVKTEKIPVYVKVK
jgi:alpha-glucosidase (family GH31 glycosyl hydrolase)